MDRGGKSVVGDLVQQALRKHPAFSANPLGDWKEMMGESAARSSQPMSLKKKVLKVVVHDSIWKHHLELNAEALIAKINRGRPEPIVEKIVFKIGEVPETMPVINPNHQLLEKMGSKRRRGKSKRKVPLRGLTEEEKDLLAALPDPELRKIGKRLLGRLPLEEEEMAGE